MDAKGCVVAFIVVGLLAIAVGVPTAFVLGLFFSRIVIPGLVMLALAAAAVAAVFWLSNDD
jgi:hypothetical protein